MRRLLPGLLVVAMLLVTLVVAIAEARPGGGEGYGGGSSGGSGGGGGGGGDGTIIIQLIWLCIEYPAIGIPLVIIVGIVALIRARAEKSQKAWATSAAGVPQVATTMRAATGVSRAQLDQLRAADPAFSNVLFEDLVYNLYAELQKARAQGTAALAPYLTPQLAQSLVDPRLADVHGVIIGAMRITELVGVNGPSVHVTLEFEANYVEIGRDGSQHRYYVVDRMRVFRAGNARSRPPERVGVLDCPNCGASIENVRGTHCSYCHEEVGGGRFDWTVEQLYTLKKEPRGPFLTSDTPEVGTDQPTRVDPGANMRFDALRARDPAFDWNTFQSRINVVFHKLQAGWSGREPATIRPFVSDNLFQSMMYWIDLYKQSRCRNVNENARILRIDLANVLSDATYDAITVRVFATGLDYTISDDGQIMSGSRSRERTYSEYWTLIRGARPKGPSKGDLACPNCGAELNVSMVGNCAYCGAKVTTGEFDWVLSRIEQDESYTG
ncbi:MAG: TIM44-like domain-containing protein [Polyangiaceae bacterium]